MAGPDPAARRSLRRRSRAAVPAHDAGPARVPEAAAPWYALVLTSELERATRVRQAIGEGPPHGRIEPPVPMPIRSRLSAPSACPSSRSRAVPGSPAPAPGRRARPRGLPGARSPGDPGGSARRGDPAGRPPDPAAHAAAIANGKRSWLARSGRWSGSRPPSPPPRIPAGVRRPAGERSRVPIGVPRARPTAARSRPAGVRNRGEDVGAHEGSPGRHLRSDQQRSLEFYTKTLGCELITDVPTGSGHDAPYWIEVRLPGDTTKLVLFTPHRHEV